MYSFETCPLMRKVNKAYITVHCNYWLCLSQSILYKSCLNFSKIRDCVMLRNIKQYKILIVHTWCARQIKSKSWRFRNLLTTSAPKVKDTPRSFSPQPCTSLSGSDHSKSQSKPLKNKTQQWEKPNTQPTTKTPHKAHLPYIFFRKHYLKSRISFLKIFIAKADSQRVRDRKIFFLMVHFPSSCNSQSWVDL